MKLPRIAAAAVVSGLLALTAACSSPGTKTSGDTGTTPAASGTSTATASPAPAKPAAAKPSQATIYFDYDKSSLDSADIAVLSGWAAYLSANPGVKVTLEGHCDERGSKGYNISLGERRAASARDYLASNGVSGSQLSVVSYGEERPVAMGHDESAWSKNRRVEVIVR